MLPVVGRSHIVCVSYITCSLNQHGTNLHDLHALFHKKYAFYWDLIYPPLDRNRILKHHGSWFSIDYFKNMLEFILIIFTAAVPRLPRICRELTYTTSYRSV